MRRGYALDLDKLKIGTTVAGTVVGHARGRALIAIDGCKYRATMKPRDAQELIGREAETLQSNLEHVLRLGIRLVRAKVIKFQKEPVVKIRLGTLDKYFQDNNNNEEED